MLNMTKLGRWRMICLIWHTARDKVRCFLSLGHRHLLFRKTQKKNIKTCLFVFHVLHMNGVSNRMAFSLQMFPCRYSPFVCIRRSDLMLFLQLWGPEKPASREEPHVRLGFQTKDHRAACRRFSICTYAWLGVLKIFCLARLHGILLYVRPRMPFL
jgi:hypothetical protein